MSGPPAGTAAPAGMRWPAEWEPHAATWLAWPHNPTTWPGRLERAQAAFAVFVRELAFREPVRLLVADTAMEAVARAALCEAGADVAAVAFHNVPTDDAWLRDSGPIFVRRDADGSRALLDFPFDAWGGKYPPWQRDAAVPSAVAEITGLPRFAADFVLEGGGIDGNGAGALLTTESCLLNANRERRRSHDQMERRLADWLGVSHVIWLSAGIAGDDTDGHIDDIARFVAPRTVVAAVAPPGADDHAALAENLLRLRNSCDAAGQPLDVVELPMPPPLSIDGLRCPASYANFYVANDCVLVPTFDADTDARALAILAELYPRRTTVGIPSRELVLGLGALHCLSQQEPA
jgi:agmatine deiminase